ncbi:MAG: hypothetical protein SVS85_01560, partial [Candidatus Nanohaloarchaea archaeon]|nr:hypothetical protein [Candidatus Nanohaloarchaea archaeon]
MEEPQVEETSPEPSPETEEEKEVPEPGTDVEREKEFVRVKPSLSFEKLEGEVEDARRAYYPLHVVETSEGRAVVDAADRSVKGAEPDLGGETQNALEVLKRGERTRGELLEALDVSLGKLQRITETLEDRGLVEQEGERYRYAGHPVFVTETEEFDPGEADSVIEEEIDAEQAADLVESELGGEPGSVETLYYPYYTAGEQVFDAVRA